MNNVTLSIIITLAIAIGVTTYRRVVENDQAPQKTFGVAVVVGALASSAALYFTKDSGKKVATEPFVLDPPAVPTIPPAGSVSMPST
jgi:hypothetical protein